MNRKLEAEGLVGVTVLVFGLGFLATHLIVGNLAAGLYADPLIRLGALTSILGLIILLLSLGLGNLLVCAKCSVAISQKTHHRRLIDGIEWVLCRDCAPREDEKLLVLSTVPWFLADTQPDGLFQTPR